jgi:DNA-binding winged helix-turn-helix (wHTH) protein
MTTEAFKIFSFDDVKVELRTGEVFKAGAAVAPEPKVFKLLVFLIENTDRLVEKEEILDVLWKDVNVTENSLASAIAKLRRTLGDDSKNGKYIQTLHARGYRFVAKVKVENDSASERQVETVLGDSGGQEGAASPHATRTLAHSVGLPQGKARPLPPQEHC